MRRIKQALGLAAVASMGVGLTSGTAQAAPEFNFIVGTVAVDWLVGTRHDDVILARAGNDFLYGRRGNDTMRGNRGNDVLRAFGPLGHSGRDILGGGDGFDVCVGDPGDRFFNCEVVRIRGIAG
jgi:Ca2+-binding RTX toxin-like protein